jgi:hypothetical protein
MSVQRPPVSPDVDLHQFFSQGTRALRRSWLVATTLGETLGFAVPALVASLAWDLHPLLSLPLIVLAGVLEGLVLGVAQSVVLRREFLGFSRPAWVAATAIGAGAAWLLAMLAVTSAPVWTEWSPVATIPLGIVLGSALLASIGFAQWTVLRHHVARSRTWVPVNAVAWAMGIGVLMGISTPLWHEGQPTVLVIAIGLLGGVAMALTVALVTGLWLARLVAPRSHGSSAARTPSGVPGREWSALGEPTDGFRVFDPALLHDLPKPVQRWMRHVVAPGAALLTGVETEWTGHLRMGRSWRRFCSRQRATLGGGYVWAARTRLAGLPVTGFDRYTHDEGEMRWRLLRHLRLVAGSGDEVTRSAAGRHAAELMATVPAVALDPSVRWEPVDERRAVAHLVVGGEEQSVTVVVDPLGRLREVEMERWGTPPGSPYGRHRFGALLGEERRFDSYLVPTEVVVGWHIGTRRWDEGTFLRYRLVRCSFH